MCLQETSCPLYHEPPGSELPGPPAPAALVPHALLGGAETKMGYAVTAQSNSGFV